MKLRYFLILIFFVLSLTPVLLFRAWPYTTVLENELDEVHDRHLLLAHNIAAALERYHRDVSATFSLLISDPKLWQGKPEISRHLSNLNIRRVCIADPGTGRVTASLSLADKPCPATVPRATLQRLLAMASPGEITFGEVVEAPDGENIMHLVTIRPDGALAIGSITTAYFQELGSAISFGVNGHAAIVDHAGNVLSHPRPDWVAERKNITAVTAVQRMLRGETGVHVFYTAAFDADMVAGFTTVKSAGWGVMIPQPLEELLSKAETARQSATVILLAGVAGALVFALLFSVLLARPLEEVTNAARKVADGGKLALPRAPRSLRFLPKEFGELVGGYRDMILQLRDSTAKINALAFVDTVTGLANREYFRRRVDAFVDIADDEAQACALFLDLDGFKAVNDTKGHDVGDEVLVRIAHRIAQNLGVPLLDEKQPDGGAQNFHDPVVARLGGDEFAVFLPFVDLDEALQIAGDLLAVIERPVISGESKLSLSASIGVARFPEDASDCTSLLKAADTAMYESKRSGKNQVSRYSGTYPTRDSRRQQLADGLFSKDVAMQIDMFFQPVYDAQDLSLSSVESLLRWHHPELGLLAPDMFFDVAGELGLMRKIDQMAVERTAEIAAEMARHCEIPVGFSVNLSLERLGDRLFVDSLINQLPLACPLAIELTESSVLGSLDTRAAWTIDRLKEAGVAVQLDDFGASHASLSSLLDLAPTCIKLDSHLVSRAAEGNQISTIIRSTAAMAHDLGIEVAAKGVESVSQIELLRDLGCDHVQGYALNLPMTPHELYTYISGSAPKAAV